MVATIEQLMRATLLEVFNERDGERRRAAIARTYTPDVRFADPEETVQKILDGAPGFLFTADGPVRITQDLGYLAWNFGSEGAAPVVRGADIALVADGLITSVHTLLLTD